MPMYRVLILAVVALLAGQPAPLLAPTAAPPLAAAPRTAPLPTAPPANAPPPTAPPLAAPAADNSMLPYVVALGAIAGVVVFNVAALGLEAVPGGMAYAGA